MKKFVKLICIFVMIVAIIIIATAGFNVGLKYSENTQININLGKEFEVKDMKEITKEVFGNKSVIVQQVELYKDMAQITVKDVTDEQLEQLNNKINEKYELENEVSDIIVTKNANTRLRYIIKPYILPIAISSVLLLCYAIIRFKKLGIAKVIYDLVVGIIGPQALLFSGYAILRIPIGRVTEVIALSLYIVSAVLVTAYLLKKEEK